MISKLRDCVDAGPGGVPRVERFIRNDNDHDFEIYILPCSSNTNSAAQLSTSLFRSDSMAKEIAQHAEVL